MHNREPIISVIMPVYNTEKYLKEAIESVINQTFVHWELICVNDGSTDNSLNILLQYESMDVRIIAIDSINSGSAAAARNVALKSCNGIYLHFLDSDDVLSKDCLEISYKKIISTNADCIIPDMRLFTDDIRNNKKYLKGYLGNRQILLTPMQAFKASLEWNISGIGLFRTEVVKKFGFDETGMNGDEYSTRLLFLNFNKIGFSKGTYYYRQHVNSTTKKVSIKLFDRLITNFRILALAEDYQAGEKAISICKNIILNSIVKYQVLLTASNDDSLNNRKFEIQRLIKTHYTKVDSSYLKYNGSYSQYIRNNVLFSNFRFLKIYAFYRVNVRSVIKN